MSTLSDRAVFLLRNGFNCAQSVAVAFSEKYGLEKKEIARAACGFGGGMHCGSVCGACTGGIMVIGFRHGNASAGDDDAKQNCYRKTTEFMDAFIARTGAFTCPEMLGCDIRTLQGRKQAARIKAENNVCEKAVLQSALILEALGY
jgi:C_GCAxxG_C_C family probable redox protein